MCVFTNAYIKDTYVCLYANDFDFGFDLARIDLTRLERIVTFIQFIRSVFALHGFHVCM